MSSSYPKGGLTVRASINSWLTKNWCSWPREPRIDVLAGRIICSVLVFLLRLYRTFVSPLYPPCCRYVPTCSEYAVEAVRMHGCLTGMSLALTRIMRCHPLGGSGYDPVPPPRSQSAAVYEASSLDVEQTDLAINPNEHRTGLHRPQLSITTLATNKSHG
ncbi:MAG: membrane protein insertion efficiency factor YidD [Deltaproteobacteria bacterium]|nr:membrane protein insertion efficiency factor YidD [Deltaproteobacteria bacterium]